MTNSTASTVPATAPADRPDPVGDPRPLFARAVAIGTDVIANVTPRQFGDPTPCPDYDVHTLLGHIVASLRNLAAAGRGADPAGFPNVATDVADDEWSAAWAAAADEVDVVFTDEVLDQALTLPFAVLPGRVAMTMFISEVTLHTWDLAAATGQTPDWDDDIAGIALAAMKMGLPAEPRGSDVPFAAVVDVADDARAVDQLVAWSGRNPAAQPPYGSAA